MDPAALADALALDGSPFAALPAFLTSLAIGLLIGVERERKPQTIAGIRTFALTSLLGTLCAMLDAPGAGYATPVGLAAVALMALFARAPAEPPAEPRTTTVVALLIAYGLGALVWRGAAELAVAGAIVTTALLYLKPELTGLSHRLSRRDLLSLLQFAALTFIALPLLPDRAMGPALAFNPYRIWLMVVLIVGINLAGYLAVRLMGERVNGPLLGVLGGLVSSTATSAVYARAARKRPETLPLAASIILSANLTLFARLTLLAALVEPTALPAVAGLLLPALLLGTLTLLPRRGAKGNGARPELALANPTELRMALGFAALYAAVGFLIAWLGQRYGHAGVYAVALLSGVNDVDAISLSLYALFGDGRLAVDVLRVGVALAVVSNSAFKLGLIASLGGRPLLTACLPTFAATLVGLAASLAWPGAG
ncbi:MgtC/SapB family protein [Crenobacter luteus]|uniref:Magnesium transporter MgtC n=1 Tax=Crenobacter luteus TaxID=1452487 RepID=A0A165ENH1_9NEIS|nr:DUF4010 domain-containing protein [Crenobacter luteus]KZE27276.1 magnesium transporter MgtC [Crenobacter luteus]